MPRQALRSPVWGTTGMFTQASSTHAGTFQCPPRWQRRVPRRVNPGLHRTGQVSPAWRPPQCSGGTAPGMTGGSLEQVTRVHSAPVQVPCWHCRTPVGANPGWQVSTQTSLWAEPAQVLRSPACRSWGAVGQPGVMHWAGCHWPSKHTWSPVFSKPALQYKGHKVPESWFLQRAALPGTAWATSGTGPQGGGAAPSPAQMGRSGGGQIWSGPGSNTRPVPRNSVLALCPGGSVPELAGQAVPTGGSHPA
mmetsp:Transcript_40952/g.107552  ORF Transcript_40952/g.107552 Transcript_40952/m.107552 type:complete len:249 (-) Transcript_40952:867-1613(-)